MRCNSLEGDDTIAVTITDISTAGARLSLERMQVGSRHLFVRDLATEYELVIPMGEDRLKLPVVPAWYNLDEGEHIFSVGLSFTDTTGEDRRRLKSIIDHLENRESTPDDPAQRHDRD